MNLRVLEPQYGGTFLTEVTELSSSSISPDKPRFVLPGELIQVDSGITKPIVLEQSASRTHPECRHFGACGGCDYQHATYPSQLELKQQILLRVLQDATLDNLPSVQSHTAHPWHYRNRIRLRLEGIDGIPHLGYNIRGSRDFLPIVECPIAAPLLWRAAEALCTVLKTESAAAAWLPSLCEVEFHTNSTEQSLQMTVLTHDARTHGFQRFCDAMAALVPELVGAGTLAASAGHGAHERAQWGASGLTQRILDRNLWVTRGGFFQINRFLLPELVSLVTGNRAGGLAWDLYAGVGLFSRPLAESFEAVVAVESNPLAAADLARSVRKGVPLHAVNAETLAFLRRAVLDRARPSLIVMDPPRAGLGPEVCGLLTRMMAPEMIYVSCDPTTLARDLLLLQRAGYRITDLHLFDLFPQTFHLETVVFLTLDAPRSR